MARASRPLLLLLLATAILLPAPACVRRVPTHSPRIPPTEEHLAARTPSDCLACHEAASLPRDHDPGKDLCGKCHKICHGRYE